MANSKSLEAETQTFTVETDAVGERLDIFVTRHLSALSRSKVQKLIADGAVSINGNAVDVVKWPLKLGDQVQVAYDGRESGLFTDTNKTVVTAKSPGGNFKLDILYEDDHLIVINKAAGLSVHAAEGKSNEFTLVDALLQHGKKWSRMAPAETPDKFRPGIVHRLDRETTGTIVCCKDDATHDHLAMQFKDKTNLREYMALLDGFMATSHILRESYLHRDAKVRNRFSSTELVEYQKMKQEGADLAGYRYAKTEFWRRATFGKRITLATARLFTGRTHQIRIHAGDVKLPVLGDQVYNRPTELPALFPASTRAKIASVSRQMLHARILGIVHPVTGERLAFEAPPPADFMEIVQLLAIHDDKLDTTKP